MRRTRRWRNGTGTLTADGLDVARVEIAATYRTRRRGLLGRDGIDGAMLLTPCNSVHTIGMRFPIDVAYLDGTLRVLTIRTMPPGRVGLPRLRARHVLEAEAGALAGWGVRAGTALTVAPSDAGSQGHRRCC
ncbi:DUF192 domain-containing protein [Streptomyces peucetius]|uniref:DUF192 domain-containing protein n=1 Tax=Streptomyces peucetius TaxID=1950 RepID=A0ABY6IE64_STRPE|nr:DUF192 domain-containing protein [Streptomyces peucetius]UYQ64142.1 DUF192 domain-containing protein [Streptomyces peucetius]